jgi:hypothetical protein
MNNPSLHSGFAIIPDLICMVKKTHTQTTSKHGIYCLQNSFLHRKYKLNHMKNIEGGKEIITKPQIYIVIKLNKEFCFLTLLIHTSHMQNQMNQ